MSLYQEHFYHKTIFKSVATFGTLFNDITVKRTDKSGVVVQDIKVPLTYSPRGKFLSKIYETADNVGKKTAINLPVIGFEISGFAYDPTRKQNSLNKRFHTKENDIVNRSYSPVPYSINFSVSIYVENFDDGLQIVEQILPFFDPYLNIPSKLVYDDLNIVDDVSVCLDSVALEEEYQGEFTARRVIQWNLIFTMKTNIFKPVVESGLIRSVESNLYSTPTGNSGEVTPQEIVDAKNNKVSAASVVTPGLDSSGEPTSKKEESIPKEDIDADDNYGFITDFLDGV